MAPINFMKVDFRLSKKKEMDVANLMYDSFPLHAISIHCEYTPIHAFFYGQHQAEIGKKIKQMLSNTLRLNFYYLKIIHILHPRYHPKTIGHILRNKQTYKWVCIHEITRLIIMKMEMKMTKRSHRYDINRPRSR